MRTRKSSPLFASGTKDLIDAMWGTYEVDSGEVHVHRVTEEQHRHGELCFCNVRIEIGTDYFLVIHEDLFG